MISLAYLSTARAPLDTAELTALLTNTRADNEAAEVTGVLLYASGHFIQTLEGDSGVVDATFDRIRQDPRHRNVQLVLRDEIEERSYLDWSTGFRTLADDEASTLPGFNDYLDGEPVTQDSGQKLGRAAIFHRVFRDGMA